MAASLTSEQCAEVADLFWTVSVQLTATILFLTSIFP